jgi:hypothetical protein
MMPPSSWLKCVSSGNAVVYGQVVRNVIMKPKVRGGKEKKNDLCLWERWINNPEDGGSMFLQNMNCHYREHV